MESVQEFKKVLLAKTPYDSKLREVVSGIRVFDDGREEIFYQATCRTVNRYFYLSDEHSTPEAAIADLIHQMSLETEEVQTDIK